MAKTLTLITTDMSKASVPFPVYHEPEDIFDSPIGSVPEYYEPTNNMMTAGDRPVHKLVDQVSRTPGRLPSPQPTHLNSPELPYKNGNGNGHRVLRSATVGYIAPEFAGKKAQKVEGEFSNRVEVITRSRTDVSLVKAKLEVGRWIPSSLIDEQIDWFYNDLGIDDVYFQTESVSAIVSNITSLYAAKIAAFAREDKTQEIRLDMEAADHAIYIDTSEPGVNQIDGPRYERKLESKYLDASASGNNVYRVETFRSPTNLAGTVKSKTTMRCYFVYQCQFVEPNADPKETRLEVIGDQMFLAKATNNTKQIYQEIIETAVNRNGPVIEYFDIEDSKEVRLVVAFRRKTATGMFTALSDLYHYYGE
jgi:glutamate dehydrogenase